MSFLVFIDVPKREIKKKKSQQTQAKLLEVEDGRVNPGPVIFASLLLCLKVLGNVCFLLVCNGSL